MYLYEFNPSMNSNELKQRLCKTFNELLQNRIPNREFSNEDLLILIESLIENDFNGWHSVNNEVILAYIVGILNIYLDKFENHASFEQDIMFSLNRGLALLGRRNIADYGYEHLLRVLNILIKTKIHNYIIENISEFEELKPFLNLVYEARKEILPKSSIQRKLIKNFEPFELLPLKNERFFQYHKGINNVIIEAPYTQSPNKEKLTREMAIELAYNLNSNVIIGKVSAHENRYLNKDSNNYRDILRDYHRLIFKLSNNNGFHIILRGFSKESYDTDIDISTNFGRSCSPYISETFINAFKNLKNEYGYKWRITENQIFNGGSKALQYLKEGWRTLGLFGFGQDYNVMEIRMRKELREYEFENLVDIVKNILIELSY